MIQKAIKLLLIISSIFHNQYSNCQIFDNYKLDAGANSVRCFIQDSQGLMWIGTNKGLYSFDGYTACPRFTAGNNTNVVISCMLKYNEDYILLGSEYGLLFYDIKNNKYTPFLLDFKHDVKVLAKTENELWIGCADGLFKCKLNTAKKNEPQIVLHKGTKQKMIFALLEDNGYMYVGTALNFGRYSLSDNKYEPLSATISFVTSLLKDPEKNCIWIGQGGSLTKYYPTTNTFENVGIFSVVKSMCFNSENKLYIGADNGLCLYNGQTVETVEHDTRDQNSLSNNVVWSVFKDRADNIWFGTDYGISVLPNERRYNYIPVSKTTGTGEGNQFYSIYYDNANNFWLGGTNGLICKKDDIGKKSETRWFKMSGSPYFISHNRIRDIFADKDKNLWVATDWGLNGYNYHSGKFIQHFIKAPDVSSNTCWVYDLLEDNNKRLWMATVNTGIYVVSKNKLLPGKNTIDADIHYSSSNGLSGNDVPFIVMDKNENVWALLHNAGINIINTKSGKISNFPINEGTKSIIPNYLMGDSDGIFWAGYRNGVIRINPKNGNVDNIPFNGRNTAEVLAMAEVDNTIWISTTDGIDIVDKKKLTTRRIKPLNQIFTAVYYHKSTKTVMLGGVDGIVLAQPDPPAQPKTSPLIISGIYINNQPYKNQGNEPDVRFINEVKLAHNQNNIKIEFSDLTYSKENKESYLYRIADGDTWTPLMSGEKTITLFKLTPGTYHLSIAKMSVNGNTPEPLKRFSITIMPPWYLSLIAKIIYSLLVISLVWWVYYFISARNRMKYEQAEKERSLEQTKHKIAYFSDLAHEFKTPLSLIIAPLSRLIQGAKTNEDKKALQMIQQNAINLNSLIHQALDYYRDDSKVNTGLLLSKTELVEFARSIFSTYKESMKGKKVEFIFSTNADEILLNIDVVKVESIINNLLSNACKFTGKSDSIILSLEYKPQNQGVEIKVSDTGTGIPEKDIPYVFQRFFQSSNNSKVLEGTGIGLFLVKNYADLHGGWVKVVSQEGEGSTFIVWLPETISNEEKHTPEKNVVNDKADRQLILIVENNIAIADFIRNTFIEEYRCVIAHNGKAGLKAGMELMPDIIISDIMMPVMDGFEMAQSLKANVSTTTIPLVFLTAQDDKDTELKSIELNVEAFISKPFDSVILYSRIKQILENREKLANKARIEHISSPKTEISESLDEKFLAKITKIIEDKIDESDLNVNLLCELADTNPKNLYRKVKQLTGLTAVEYIKSIRMKKAAMLLSNKNFTIAEVMYMVGYSNHSYFAKCFHGQFGKTPREYVDMQNDSKDE
jgi:signal transduction histidine kinase/ligand-binding sensor domain-containing protein/DNA-binding response OmpR family regulator